VTTLSTTLFALVDPLSLHRELYRKLHNSLFPNAAISNTWLDWYHRDLAIANGRYSTRTYGAFVDGALVGIWSVEPRRFVTEAKDIVDIGRCFAVGIHPDYRRHGLFVELSKYAIDQERILGRYEYILGFPQAGRAVVGGHFKAGWDLVQEIAPHHIDLSSMDGNTPKSQLQTVGRFDALDLTASPPGSFGVCSDYLQSRWIKHPDNCYFCFSYEDSYIVLKPYGSVCHIVDLYGRPRGVQVLLNAAKTLCRRHRFQELNMWCADNELYRPEVIGAGLSQGSSVVAPVLLIAVGIRSTVPLTLASGCHFQMGVEESY
jgi:GNAT superfamily N-acetyltransferase